MNPPSDCDICGKHRGEGPLGGTLIGRTDAVWAFHAPPGDDDRAPLGYVFLESDRHVPYVADLTPAEAAELGAVRTALARGLREELDIDFVFAMVIGTGVAHVHEHLVPRHAGTARDVPWHASASAAPRADAATVADLCRRLATRMPDQRS